MGRYLFQSITLVHIETLCFVYNQKENSLQNWNGIISLLIACIELILLINLFIHAEKNKVNKMAMLLILLLMIYQSLEFLTCHFNLQSSFLPYLAFADISFLPPLGLVYTLRLFDYKSKYFSLFFLPAVSFLIYYSLVIEKFAVTSCAVFYASYNYPLGDLYGFFYYVLVIAVIVILVLNIFKSSGKKEKFAFLILSAHILMAVPVITAFVLASINKPSALDIIESVMCKFAFAYAIALSIVTLLNKNYE